MKVSMIYRFLLILLVLGCNDDDDNPNIEQQLPEGLPDVEQAVFTNPTNITNLYYGPPAGTTYIYIAGEVGEDPEEEIRIDRRTTTKVVMGVTCIIQHDVVSIDGIIIEDTDDWLAQDDEGNIWYFGEDSKNYDDEGNFLDSEGSWEAGVDGALPGYWLPIDPTVGQSYYQEFYEDEAEDQAEVISIDETVTIELGTYEDCLVTKDINPFEMGVYELKYYAPGIGLILEEKYENDILVETVELVEIVD